MAAGNVAIPVSNSTPQSTGFIKELQEKDIIAIDGYNHSTFDGNLRNVVYHLTLNPDAIVTEEQQKKIGANAETIRLQVHSKGLGSGGFGCVFKCSMKQQQSSSINESFICLKLSKHWDERTLPDNKVNYHIIREIRNFRLLNKNPHDNIIKYLFSCSTECNRVCIGLEYFPGRDLSKLVRRYHAEGSRFPSNDINTIITGVVSALKHIQQLGIIHSDIKPDNVLYNTHTRMLKVIDFGCALVYNGRRKFEFGGTHLYMAPEILKKDKQPHIDRSDIYSVGALCFRLLTLRKPWEDHPLVAAAIKQEESYPIKQAILQAMEETTTIPCDDGSQTCYTFLQSILHDPQADHSKIYPNHCSIICGMLHSDPELRPTCDTILSLIIERCSDIKQRRDSRNNMSQLTANLAAANLESQDQYIPDFSDLEKSDHSVLRSTQPMSAIVSEDRRLDREYRMNSQSHSEVSQTSASRFERQSSSQKTGYPLDPITESNADFSEDALGDALQIGTISKPTNNATQDDAPYTLDDSPGVFDWSDVDPSVNAWHSEFSDIDSWSGFPFDSHSAYSNASMTYHVDVDHNAQLLNGFFNNLHQNEDSSMPSLEKDDPGGKEETVEPDGGQNVSEDMSM